MFKPINNVHLIGQLLLVAVGLGLQFTSQGRCVPEIDTWQAAVETLFVNPRGDPIEHKEALRLLELSRGRKVGPYDVDYLLSFHEVKRDSCGQDEFDKFDQVLRLCSKGAKTLELYLEMCLKRQVEACGFQHNFKRTLALMDDEPTRSVERLAQLIEDPREGFRLKLNAKSLVKEYDSQRIAEGILLMLEREAHDIEQPFDRNKLGRALVGYVDMLKQNCGKWRSELEKNLAGALRIPDLIREDRTIKSWFKVMQICHSVENESQMIDQVYRLLLIREEKKGKVTKSIDSLKAFFGFH